MILSRMQYFTNILELSNISRYLCCDPLAQWYDIGFACKRPPDRFPMEPKSFFLTFYQIFASKGSNSGQNWPYFRSLPQP